MTKLKIVAAATGLLMLALGSAAFAQTQTTPQTSDNPMTDRPRMGQRMDKMFDRLDTNHDGVVSKEEWLAVHEKRFNQLDANHDGVLSREELDSARGAMRGAGGMGRRTRSE